MADRRHPDFPHPVPRSSALLPNLPADALLAVNYSMPYCWDVLLDEHAPAPASA